MLSVKFTGNSIEVIAKEARRFADAILGERGKSTNSTTEDEGKSGADSYGGYRPVGVGISEYYPVDDGREWNEEALRDWLDRLSDDGREAVKVLAKGKIIDQREEARKLKWSGSYWAGVWTGPRRQAGYVMDERKLRAWPYGHTYEEPRRMWMHEDIANRVLNIINEG